MGITSCTYVNAGFNNVSRIEHASADLLQNLHGVRQHSSEGSAVHNSILPLAVLDDVIGQVEEAEPMRGLSWERKKKF